MPPWGFRKRSRSPDPSPELKKNASKPRRSKPTVFDTVDAPNEQQTSLDDSKKFLQDLDGGDDDDSSLSEADTEDFEDVPPAKRQKTSRGNEDVKDEDEDDDEMDWEDAIQGASSSHTTPKTEQEIGDISISINDDGGYVQPTSVTSASGKKGPSKMERNIRNQTHCLHVQALMWHNTIRNSWLNDKEVQKSLVDGLSEGVKREINIYKKAMATLNDNHQDAANQQPPTKGKGKGGKKGKDKNSGRDWNDAAQYQDPDQRSDPVLRLLKVLTAYWRKRFTVTAPGLRKQGYKHMLRLRDEIRAFEKSNKDQEECGELIQNVDEFRKLAKSCEGSRDVGAQLFVALLRGLGLEARMVANLQPVGFGWSKAEDANPKKTKKSEQQPHESESEEEPDEKVATPKHSTNPKKTAKKETKPSRKSSRGKKSDPIDLDDSDSPLSSAPSEGESELDDDLSVVDITPSTPKKKSLKKYDRDLPYPIYWAELCSSVSHKYIPVDPIVLSTIASNSELLSTFEPRGKKAEKTKQVIAYTVGFSADGTAKDVTIRYLKKHQLPGKTKGFRMPIEKIPLYNRKGKVIRYEDYDWFRAVMAVYDRPENKRTVADNLEEQTDLKVSKPEKGEQKSSIGKESLQGYKQSAEFVLEQHLRREEAIRPGAEPVKYFTAGKGDKAKEHAVYRRDDIATCKTVESWHKDGRSVRVGEQPMKYVPMRAVTLVRKREMEDTLRETGEKATQGLYAEEQTDEIIPPPIENGVIPKNAFGNMDVYRDTMVPKGAVHLRLKGSAKICKKLGIDFAEACVGFEFGKQRAVPVLEGVVVAKENKGMVRDAWRADQAEIKRKNDEKRTAAALHWWRKMLLGLRVIERMRTEYAGAGGMEESNPFVQKARREGRLSASNEQPLEDMGGGFLPDGYDEDEEEPDADQENGGGFSTEDGTEDNVSGGGFLVEDNPHDVAEPPSKTRAPITPVSLQSMHKTADGAADSDEEVVESEEPSLVSNVRSTNNRKQLVPNRSSTKATRAEGRGKSRVSISDGDAQDESPLSDLSELDDAGSESDSDSEDSPPSNKKSAHVVVSRQKTTNSGGRARNSRAAAKTPVRSQYFKHSSDEDDAQDDDSDVEVVKPRKTTARTRSSR